MKLQHRQLCVLCYQFLNNSEQNYFAFTHDQNVKKCSICCFPVSLQPFKNRQETSTTDKTNFGNIRCFIPVRAFSSC